MKHRASKAAVAAAVAAVTAMAVSPASQAQWAVIDVGSIAELIEQLYTMEQQLETMQSHYRQAQQEYQSITGSRGMQSLLSGTVRNYLSSAVAKLGARNRIDALGIARDSHWI